MRMIRTALTLAACALSTTPVIAQDADADSEAQTAGEFADALRDPQTQATVTAAVAILGEVMLDLPIGPLVSAMDEAVDRAAEQAGTSAPPRPELAPDASLRDMLGPQGDRLTVELAQRVPQAMDAAAGMAGAARQAVPVLQDLAERLKRALPAGLPVMRLPLPLPRRD